MARILIAEDEEVLCALCARALRGEGHEVVTAADGSEALEVLTREDGRFDLLLTDIRMPIMDGIALALAAARDFSHLTILLMTGYADQRERAYGLDAIVRDVITKPFSVATLRDAVNVALAVKARA
jgi:two-component system, cell cycle response regulator CpdR